MISDLYSKIIPASNILVVLVIVAVGAVAMRVFAGMSSISKQREENYALKKGLFTPAERSFLGCLDSILPADIRVFAKVRLADLFEVAQPSDRSAWYSAFNKINSKHVDFILCRADDLSPLLAIELDDKSHEREDRKGRDALLDNLFSKSNLPLLRFKVQKSYQTEDIANRLNEALTQRQ